MLTERPTLAELTVVVPVWGSYTRFLPELLTCLRAEGVPAANLVVVANGVPLELAGARVLQLCERLSAGAARNAGATLVTTELVCFCDADDLPVHGALARLCAAAAADPDAVAISGLVVRVNGAPYPWPPRHATRRYGRTARTLRQWGRNHLSLTTGTVIRASAFRRSGGFPDYSLAEDGMLGCVLCWLGRIVVLDEPTRIYRQHPEGLCQRGLSAGDWRDSYRFQRHFLAGHHALPSPLRWLTRLYAPQHRKLARALAQQVRHDR